MADHPDLTPDERQDVQFFSPLVARELKEDEALLQAEKQILDLLEHPGWALVQTIIAKAVDASSLKLRYSSVQDHATMSRDVGMQAGMESQRNVAQAIVHLARKRQEKIAQTVERREAQTARREA